MPVRPEHSCRDRNKASLETTNPRPTKGEEPLPCGTVLLLHRFYRFPAQHWLPPRSCRNLASPLIPWASLSLSEPVLILAAALDAGPGHSHVQAPDIRAQQSSTRTA